MNTPLDLEVIVQQTVAEFLFEGFDFKTYYVENSAQHVYAIITSSTINRSLVAFLAHIEDDKVFIEVDTTSKPEIPLYKVLMSKGIPRERMVLTYVGEHDPDKYHSQ